MVVVVIMVIVVTTTTTVVPPALCDLLLLFLVVVGAVGGDGSSSYPYNGGPVWILICFITIVFVPVTNDCVGGFVVFRRCPEQEEGNAPEYFKSPFVWDDRPHAVCVRARRAMITARCASRQGTAALMGATRTFESQTQKQFPRKAKKERRRSPQNDRLTQLLLPRHHPSRDVRSVLAGSGKEKVGCCCRRLRPAWPDPHNHPIVIIMDVAQPSTSKWQTTTMTTAPAAAEKAPTSIPDEERQRVTVKDNDRTVMDLLRSLPTNIVADYIYPFAVKVIRNREQLIVAVDEYLDEFYRDEFFDYRGQRRRIDRPAAGLHVGNHPIRYPIGDWDVSRVTDFTKVFDEGRNPKAKNFNEDLSRWNVSNGTSFVGMFLGCHVFQSDLSNWNTAKATDFNNMFRGCTSFNADLSSWNVTNATSMYSIFWGCTKFNSDLSRWNVANATNLRCMFVACTSFNADLSRWNVANVTDLSRMFLGCSIFDSDLSRWNVTNTTDFKGMFEGCIYFTSDLSRWDVANATDFSRMFWCCSSFNADLSRWNVANATDLNSMFVDCTRFNSDLSRWNVANATDMSWMFSDCFNFHSDLSDWDVTNAIGSMSRMFCRCESLDRTFMAIWPLPDEGDLF
jgi:surface protein